MGLEKAGLRQENTLPLVQWGMKINELVWSDLENGGFFYSGIFLSVPFRLGLSNNEDFLIEELSICRLFK